ncbi:hypothetical protein GCM10029964_088620 [Kibdelosporangium lantanae]
MRYANSNHVLLGMLIGRVTGTSWGQQVRDRIIRPLGLSHTMVPDLDTRLPSRHAHGYVTVTQPHTRLVDITDVSMTAVDAAGSIISTTRDVDTFFGALLGVRLTSPGLLDEMLRPFPGTIGDVAGYGLGLMTLRLSGECGGETLYGHGGGTAYQRTASRVTFAVPPPALRTWSPSAWIETDGTVNVTVAHPAPADTVIWPPKWGWSAESYTNGDTVTDRSVDTA